jgi:pyridine nucleotide-disulfide oxidoreductase family protein
MRQSYLPRPVRSLVLVGAGHTHLHVVRKWRMTPIPDAQLTLISEFDQAAYSGMLPGTLAGLYQPREMQIDLQQLTRYCAVRLVLGSAVGIDLEQRTIGLADGRAVPYDVASIGIGSVPARRDLWQNRRHVIAVKPMQTFLSRLHERLADWPGGTYSNGGRALQVAIVGGGAAGVEIGFCLDMHLKHSAISAVIRIVESSDEILTGTAAGAVQKARRELDGRGIIVETGREVADLHDDGHPQLIFADGPMLPVDLVIWATGAAAPPVLTGFPLPKTPDGFLAVLPTLQSIADEPVFAVGDAATILGFPIPKAGVYAVRQAPILWKNLHNFCAGKPLVEYRPQKRFLSLMATGDERAILQYHGFSSHSHWAWKLKDWIDRRFVRQYQFEPDTWSYQSGIVY